MNTIGVILTVTVFLTVHTFIMKMFKNASKTQVKKSSVVRSKFLR